MGGAAESSTGPGSAPRAIGAGRPGPVRSALRKALQEARDAQRMTTEHEVRALVADRQAAIVDEAARRGDERVLLTASDKLLELLDTLPVRTTDAPGGGGADDGGAAGAALLVLRGSPTLGDTADA
ncbi:hypothetical protein [Nocardioides kongjuensis]|uniref:Uncharacterized protein n=2 Tax=Nocardioides kongjuensis TaxID=349522 RepID=A0A852RSJ5_9ACTN|nr:hypothetical protein [Nocardioides kongjuensis]NYD33855.1 hypothetical protein [Nocardioides kongjuensis]